MAASPTTPTAISTRASVALLVLFWLGLLPLFAVWLHRDLVFAPWDQAHHAGLVLKLHDGLARFNVWSVYELSKYYPPLFHVLAVPASLFSSHPDAFASGNWLALLALMVATCWMGRPTLGDAGGLAAGLLVSAYVYVAWMGRMVMTDLTLAAAVAVTLALLATGKPLGEPGHARRLGISIGLGMLAKWSYAFFLALPLLDLLVAHRRRTRGDARAFRRPLLVAALWAAAIAGPWYVRSTGRVLAEAPWHFGAGVMRAEGDPEAMSGAALRYYFDALGSHYLTLPTLALLLLGAVTLVARPLLSRAGWTSAAAGRLAPVLLAPLSGLAFLLAITNKDFRYVLPVVSSLAVVSAAPLFWLGPRAKRAALVAVAVLAWATAWWSLFRAAPPSSVDWQVERTAEILAARMRAAGDPFDVLVVPNDEHMNFMSLDYAIERLLREKVSVDRLPEPPLDRGALEGYGAVVTVEPPLPDGMLSRGSAATTQAVATDPSFAEVAALPRGDGRTVRVFVPRSVAKAGQPT